MKKIILIVLILISVNLFAQKYEFVIKCSDSADFCRKEYIIRTALNNIEKDSMIIWCYPLKDTVTFNKPITLWACRVPELSLYYTTEKSNTLKQLSVFEYIQKGCPADMATIYASNRFILLLIEALRSSFGSEPVMTEQDFISILNNLEIVDLNKYYNDTKFKGFIK